MDGLRVTDGETVKVSEMVLCGSINKQISAAISRLGGRALGLSGKDDSLLVAERTHAAGSLAKGCFTVTSTSECLSDRIKSDGPYGRRRKNSRRELSNRDEVQGSEPVSDSITNGETSSVTHCGT